MPAPRVRQDPFQGIDWYKTGSEISYARVRTGFPQVWRQIDPAYYGSKRELVTGKEMLKAELRLQPRRRAPKCTLTWGEYWRQYLPKIKTGKYNKASTKRTYRYVLEGEWISALDREKLVDVDSAMIEQLIERMEAGGLSRKSIATYLIPVQKLFSYAINIRHDYPRTNPVTMALAKLDDLVSPAAEKKPVIPYTDAEMKALFDALPDRYRCLVAMGWYTGARISELLGLRWGDLHFGAEPHVVFDGQLDPKDFERVDGLKNGWR